MSKSLQLEIDYSTPPTDGQVPVFDAAEGKWEPRDVPPYPSFNWTTSEQVWPFEKIDGDTVYAKMFVVASLPNNTTLNIPHGVAAFQNVLECRTVATNGSFHTVSATQFGTALFSDVNGANVRVVSTANYSAFSGKVFLRYTKPD